MFEKKTESFKAFEILAHTSKPQTWLIFENAQPCLGCRDLRQFRTVQF
jgi:hypothetical protein